MIGLTVLQLLFDVDWFDAMRVEWIEGESERLD